MIATKESVAYDYSRFDNRPRVRKAAKLAPLPKEEQAPTRVKKPVRRSRTNAIKTGFLLVVMGVICCTIVYNYMRVTELSIESSKLKSQLSDYQNEEVVLRAQQEKLYNLADIENYVQNELGFSQMGQDQVSYVELSNPDTVIRMEAPSQDSYLLSGLLKSFNAVVEYLN